MADARRPTFSRAFPRVAELDALVDAFARGDYATVRARAPELARSDDEALRGAARTLVERTKPDPLLLGLLVITALLLLVVAGYWAINERVKER